MLLVAALLAAAAAALTVRRPPAPPTVGRHGSHDGSVARLSGQPDGAADPLLLRIAAAAGAAATALLLTPGAVGPPVAVAAGWIVWIRSRTWEPASVRKRRARVAAELPHLVDLLVAALAAGGAPGASLERVARVLGPPMTDELRGWVSRLAMGADPVSVWSSMARHPELGRLGVALGRSAESGAPVVDALVRLAEDLRGRHRSQVETRVRAIEVKATVPLAVCLLPAFVLVGVVPLVAGSVSALLLGG